MRRPVRLRLALTYGGAVLAVGALLVGLICLLTLFAPFPSAPSAPTAPGGAASAPVSIAEYAALAQRRLLVNSALALAVMAVLALVVGWFMAGRVLRPITEMTETVRRMTADRLDGRLAMPGPDDELKELADTFDNLMDRLQAAFVAQRRFIANASHELRTPLTLQQTLAEVALTDDQADAGALRAVLQRVVVAGREQEKLIEALLTLARSQQGLHQPQDTDLATLVTKVLGQRANNAVPIGARLGPASVSGDPALLERLIANLVDNATRYNRPDGTVTVATGMRTTGPMTAGAAADRAVLWVSNTGPAVAPQDVPTMLEPFQRLGTGRGRSRGDGLGLGLSIVAAIVDAHRGTLDIRPRPGGGLDVSVTFHPLPRDLGAV